MARLTGMQRTVYQSNMQFVLPCDACAGKGKVISSPCSACGGNGRVKRQKTEEIMIPAGIDTGHTLCIRAAGSSGASSKAVSGDLFVKIQVAKSPIFERVDSDIFVHVNVPFYTALLGGQIRVPTIDGDVNLQLKPGVKEGDRTLMGGRGVPVLSNGYASMTRRGNQVNIYHITLPKSAFFGRSE